MFDITAIGGATQDLFIKANLESVKGKKWPQGEAYLLPAGAKLPIEEAILATGGNALNAAVTLARQGLKTALAAAVGNDGAGREITEMLKREKIRSFLKEDEDNMTARAVIFSQAGERTILNYSGANDHFSLSEKDFSKLASRWWYVSLGGRSAALFPKIVDWAQRHNIALAFNPAGYHLRARRAEIMRFLPAIDVLVLNQEEAAFLTGISFRRPEEVFKKLDKKMPGILAITDGRNGAVISDNRFIYEAGIFANKKIVDRTGAGDAFASGLVAGLLRQRIGKNELANIMPEKVKEALRLAMANAAAKVEKIGANNGVLTKREFSFPRWQSLMVKVRKA
ncbi:MAG: carbohydrate kinase family protein [bacterium]|nr:carbohydrate kinase family protein [bacterium]